MNHQTIDYFRPKQATLPLLISDFLDVCDPVLTFDEFMEEIDLNKYLTDLPKRVTGRIRYNPVNMLTVLFGFMTSGYRALWELEDNCKVNIRFMYLMDNERPAYRTFGYFINKVMAGSTTVFLNRNMRTRRYSFTYWLIKYSGTIVPWSSRRSRSPSVPAGKPAASASLQSCVTNSVS